MAFPQRVKMVEVGPRDGLQNEKKIVPTMTKIEWINQLSATGLSAIEVTSFVSPQWIPALADHREVFQAILKKENVSYSVLVPNVTGMQNAADAGVREIAVFTTPSEQFCQQNINCSVVESLDRIAKVIAAAKQRQIRVRGYLSCVLGCPFEGKIALEKVADLAGILVDLGCYEISLGDTIGVGTPLQAKAMLQKTATRVPWEQMAVHFHDTYGQALANIYAALECGVAVVDSAVAGLGGCPYAKGATGNVASEEVLYLLNGMQITTGVDLKKLINTGRFITEQLGIMPHSKVSLASKNS